MRHIVVLAVICALSTHSMFAGVGALSIIEKYNATLSVLNDTHGKTCAVFFYTNVRCNATASNCITLANSTNITNSSQVNATNSSLTNNTANNSTSSAYVPQGEYRRKCYICPLATFVNQTNGGCSFISCNATKQYSDGYCIKNVTKEEKPVIIDVTRVVYTNESLALINILSTFILENDSYVMWNLIFAVTVLTYVLYLPRILSFLIAFGIKTFLLGKDKDLKIGNIRFAFLGGKLALHNVQYVSKNVLVRIQRLVMTFRWWAPVYRKEERWVMDREHLMGQGRHNHPSSHGRNSTRNGRRNHYGPKSKGQGSSNGDGDRKQMNNNGNNTSEETGESRFDLPYRITLDILGLEMMAFNNSDVYDELEKLAKQKQRENKRKGKKTFEEINSGGKTRSRRSTAKSGRRNGTPNSDEDQSELDDSLNSSNFYGDQFSRAESIDENTMNVSGGGNPGGINTDILIGALDLPWFYKIAPTLKIRMKCANLYAGNQRTPTI